jgi:phosphoglycolate phosphatase-like HAD superfamily hydrolase
VSRLLSFDVDGTILATRDLVTRAYREIGIEMPEHAWGLRWEAWLPSLFDGDLEQATIVHRAKTEVYEELVRDVNLRELLLPPGRLAYAHLAGARGPVRYFTAGSSRPATIILARLGILGRVESGLDYDRRAKLLRDLPPNTPYVDDRLDTIVRLQRDGLKLNLVHFRGQSYEKLLEDVLWNRWTQ